AAWTGKVRSAWPKVAVEHVDSLGVLEEPQIGDVLTVQAYVALGGLSPQDVSVEVAFGRALESDELTDTQITVLDGAEELDNGRYLFTGDVVIDRSGSFGYTVRVLPSHPGLASKAELGLIVNA
ncbi:MAG TPA: hypothetical protein VGN49_07660, partial [Micrococcaceae bacterium]|nr:hypothetical protein [Micrococcaceae bacterium]